MIQTTGKEMQIQKKGEKKRDEREFRCEEVFTRQYLGSSTHIVIYNIQVLGGGKKQKKKGDTGRCQPKNNIFVLPSKTRLVFQTNTHFVNQRSKKILWVRFLLI
jgi:hypothetical protein